jgi:hypothetical protein
MLFVSVCGFCLNAHETGTDRPFDPNPWTQDVFVKPANFSGVPSLTFKKEIQFL